MRFEINLGPTIPIGFAASTASESAATAQVRLSGFYSSEDGDLFVRHLDGVSEAFLDRLPPGQRPRESNIDNLAVVLHRDGRALVYVNELILVATVRAKRDIAKGELLRKDDIADIQAVHSQGISFPAEAALLILLSSGWRKGLLFDYTPIAPFDAAPRMAPVETLLAEMVTYLAFQDRLKVSEDQWTEMLRQRWFPFVGLSTDQLRSMLAHAELKESIDPQIERLTEDGRRIAAKLRTIISSHPLLVDHKETLTRGLSYFESGDYVSCTTMLMPRIEGVLRTRLGSSATARPSQQNLADAAAIDSQGERHRLSILLPHKFTEFLRRVYFAPFDPAHVVDVSRNTVSHGVAPEAQLSHKNALLSVLTLDQLIRLMPAAPRAST